MRKRRIGVIVGIVVLGLAIIGFVLINSQSDDKSARRQASSQTPQAVAQTTQASIKDFLTAGDKKKCTFSKNNESGTMYFANQRLRSDIQRSRDGATSKVSMIVTASVQYVWFDNNQGLKLQYSTDSTDNSAVSQGGLDTTQTYDFTCTDWAVDEAKFIPPPTINFMDLSKLVAPGVQ